MNLRSYTKWIILGVVALLIFIGFTYSNFLDKPRILVFSKTSGYHHASIAKGNTALMQLATENGMDIDTTTNASFFTDDSLKKYAAVVFLSTTGDVLNHYQEAAFERYIQSGGGFVGIHSATDTEYEWGWFGRLVGGYFKSHPKTQPATLVVADQEHGSTRHLPKEWKRTDEWYNYKNLNKDVKVLISLDEKSYEGGENGEHHPIAWYHEYDGGRAFYTGLGHTEESYADSLYLQHVLGGIQYAIGNNKRLDYSKAKTQNVPEEDRFVKNVLAQGVFIEPTEMTILPDMDILVSQRRGEIMLYSSKDQKVKQAGFLDVYFKTNTPGVNAEEGVLGIAADPDFKNNNFVYVFYSPADTSVNRLSRFTFVNDTLDRKTEKVVLEFYSQREICCHTGGSIAFGPDNMLYLSTGDNSTPFDEPNQKFVSHGYAPLDARQGHEQYDARRGPANTNDLRGKILRIKIKPDGTYDIPEGNLFPKNDTKARPEIYTMGHRNPYRISVDKKNGFLYWGEVGPDARVDSLDTRGPRGYDEVNQARKAGFFGWPLFIANNYPYRSYDYATGKFGEEFNPAKPVNNSPNNTGLTELPPAEPAFIWYPYAESKDFPQVGAGGRNAMAGPVYYTEFFPKETRYPEYYNGKFFIYDWIRNWVKVVTMQPNGDFDKMEPFMENTAFSALMDMEVGPDGKIYALEYGQGWFSKNSDAGISRIDYLPGNRPPKITDLTIEKTNGNLPFILTASVTATDPENDPISYIWYVGNQRVETKEPHLQHTISKAGAYMVSVEAVDGKKASSNSNQIEVYAGNDQPQVNIALEGNKTFYFTGRPVNYKVMVADNGDKVNMENLYVASDYIQGKDLAGASMGHQVVSETMLGKNLMLNSDCKACHKIDEPSFSPSFTQIAEKYKKDRMASEYLTTKIIKGGTGVWGENTMPAHPTMPESEAKQIVKWVRSLANTGNTRKSLPAAGNIIPEVKEQQKQNTVLRLVATYTDNGSATVRPLSGMQSIHLRSNNMDVSDFLNNTKGFTSKDSSGASYLAFPAGEGWIKGEKLDLSGIKGIELTAFGGEAGKYQVEVRKDKQDGNKIGEAIIDFANAKQKLTAIVPLQTTSGNELQDVYLIFKPIQADSRALLKTVSFMPQ
jgi:cytochrome c